MQGKVFEYEKRGGFLGGNKAPSTDFVVVSCHGTSRSSGIVSSSLEAPGEARKGLVEDTWHCEGFESR